MSDAFKCDFCGEYKDGEPAVKLYEKEHNGYQSPTHKLRAEACGACEKEHLDGDGQ